MPLESPFHARTAALCTSYAWKHWGDYYAVCHFGDTHIPEYWAFREACGVTDVSPLYKYEIRGRDAERLLSRMTVRGFGNLRVGRVAYTCWCDPNGKVIDDGTVTRLDEDRWFLTAAEPSLSWLHRLARRLEVEIEDVSRSLAALSLQGPTSRDVLAQCCDADMEKLRFFGSTPARLDGMAVRISRTGYTGDLGYELWCDADDALRLWDALFAAGRRYGADPAGLDALDMARIEAGFIMLGVDYFSAPCVTIDARRSTPYELGLDWCVELEREPFIGQDALRAEAARGAAWRTVGIEADWAEIEALHERYGLPPNLVPAASRQSLPLYDGDRFAGQVTSSVWSPLLKREIGLASVRAAQAAPGTSLRLEHTVLHERCTVGARVEPKPFFDPERKRKP